MLVKIPGRGRDHTPDVPDTGRDQSRIRKLCQTQRNVDRLLHEADLPVEKTVAELDCGEFRPKGVDDGPQDPGAEKHSAGIGLSYPQLLQGSPCESRTAGAETSPAPR